MKRILTLLLILSMVLQPISAYAIIDGAMLVDWGINIKDGTDARAEIDQDIKCGGNNSIHIINNTPYNGQTWINMYRNVPLEGGRTYKFGFSLRFTAIDRGRVDFGGSSYTLPERGKSSEWTEYEFTYRCKEDMSAYVNFAFDGICNVWIDDVYVREEGTEKNLVTNPSFEEIKEGAESKPSDDGEATLSDNFSKSDLTVGQSKFIPVYRVSDYKVDCVFDEWGEDAMTGMLPQDGKTVRYTNAPIDLTAEAKYAYDDEYLYMGIKVKDDVHNSLSGGYYWTADGIQFMIVPTSGSNASMEFGLIHNTETQNYELISTFKEKAVEAFKCMTKREGEYTYYDLAFPWIAVFEEMPKELKATFLVNENDGNGRAGGIEYTGTIADGTKDSTNFPVLKLMEEGQDYYAWMHGDDKAALEEKKEFEFYLVNDSEEREFTVDIPVINYSETFTVPAKSGVKRTIEFEFPEKGNIEVVADVKTGDESYIIKKNVTVERNQQQLQDYFDENYPILEERLAEIRELIAKCEEAGIPTDYIVACEAVLDQNMKWLQQDREEGWYAKLEFIIHSLDKVYTDAKALAEGYLDGTIEEQYVPRYVSGDLTLEDGYFWGDVNNHGVIERSPVSLSGYISWFYCYDYFPYFNKLGNNILQTEVQMNKAIDFPGVNEFWNYYENFPYKVYSKVVDEEPYTGKYSLKIVDPHETYVSGSYRNIYQKIEVEPNTTYDFGLYAKGQNVTNAWFSGGSEERLSLNGTYDWKKLSGTVTTGPDQTELEFRIFTERKCDFLYIDDVYLIKQGDTENLLKDPGFESGLNSPDDKPYKVNYEYLETIKEVFKDAEDNNVTIDLLLAGHTLAQFLWNPGNEYDDSLYSGGGFFKRILDADIMKQVYEDYARATIRAIKDYKSFNTICLSNEPSFKALSANGFYIDEWHEFLRERYNNDIDALNKAWGEGTEYTSFEEVPDTYGKKFSVHEADAFVFNEKIQSDWHKWLAGIVKEEAPDVLVHAKRMTNITKRDNNTYRTVSTCGASPYSFSLFSDINGVDGGGHALLNEDNIEANDHEGEMMSLDFHSSVMYAPTVNSEHHVIGGYVTAFGDADEDETDMNADQMDIAVAQNVWLGALHGRGGSEMWMFERDWYAKEGEGLVNAVTTMPYTMKEISEESLNLQRLAYEVKALRDTTPEVGIVFDSVGRFMDQSVMNTMYTAYVSLMYNGHRAHFITSETPYGMQDKRIVFVPKLTNICPELMDELKKYVDNGGRLVIMGRDTLKYDQHNNPYPEELRNYIMSRADIIDVVTDGYALESPTRVEMIDRVADLLEYEQLDHIKLVDKNTGEPIYNMDLMATTYDGKLLVSAGYIRKPGEGTKDIKVIINGKPVEQMKDLRSGKVFNGSFTIEPLESVLLEIETDNKFIDTYGHWAENTIVDMTDKEIVSGVSDTMFMPQNKITRAEFTALLARMLGLEKAAENTFSDIAQDDWFCGEVNAAAKAGITLKKNGAFDANAQISREEMAYMLKKAYELKAGSASGEGRNFTDSRLIKAEYKDAVDFVSGAGLISGYEDGSFRPQGLLTRAEAVTVLSKLLAAMI